MSNTRPLPPADINPWAKSIETDITKLIRDVTRNAATGQQALRTATTALAAIPRPQQISDWDLAIEPGDYWSYSGGTVNNPTTHWYLGQVEVFAGNATSNKRIVQTLQRPDITDRTPDVYRRVGVGDPVTWSSWVQVAGDSGWIVPTLLNDFTNGNGVAFRKLNGIVYIRGEVIRPTAPTASTAVFTLPAGYRPAYRIYTPSLGNTTSAILRIQANGNVEISSDTARTATPGYFLYSSFPADN